MSINISDSRCRPNNKENRHGIGREIMESFVALCRGQSFARNPGPSGCPAGFCAITVPMRAASEGESVMATFSQPYDEEQMYLLAVVAIGVAARSTLGANESFCEHRNVEGA